MNTPGIEDEMPWDAMLANPTANSCGPHSTRCRWVMVGKELGSDTQIQPSALGSA